MLLTTQVGGVGLTLTGADRVVIYDPSWNPATDDQAVDRAFRIGQDKDVVIYRFITCGTVEEKIYRRQVFKSSITKQMTDNTKNPYRYFTQGELKELFILDDPHTSTTQQQLEDLHRDQRVSDPSLDEHIAFLHALELYGISDHNLMFQNTPEDDGDDDDVANMSKVTNAQQLIESESSQPEKMNRHLHQYFRDGENAYRTKSSAPVEKVVKTYNDMSSDSDDVIDTSINEVKNHYIDDSDQDNINDVTNDMREMSITIGSPDSRINSKEGSLDAYNGHSTDLNSDKENEHRNSETTSPISNSAEEAALEDTLELDRDGEENSKPNEKVLPLNQRMQSNFESSKKSLSNTKSKRASSEKRPSIQNPSNRSNIEKVANSKSKLSSNSLSSSSLKPTTKAPHQKTSPNSVSTDSEKAPSGSGPQSEKKKIFNPFSAKPRIESQMPSLSKNIPHSLSQPTVSEKLKPQPESTDNKLINNQMSSKSNKVGKSPAVNGKSSTQNKVFLNSSSRSSLGKTAPDKRTSLQKSRLGNNPNESTSFKTNKPHKPSSDDANKNNKVLTSHHSKSSVKTSPPEDRRSKFTSKDKKKTTGPLAHDSPDLNRAKGVDERNSNDSERSLSTTISDTEESSDASRHKKHKKSKLSKHGDDRHRRSSEVKDKHSKNRDINGKDSKHRDKRRNSQSQGSSHRRSKHSDRKHGRRSTSESSSESESSSSESSSSEEDSSDEYDETSDSASSSESEEF